MKKILYSALTLILGLVLSSSGCNTMDAPETSWDVPAIGTVKFATTKTWKVSGNGISQTWSDALVAPDKTTFNSGAHGGPYIVDWRSVSGYKGSYFSWEAVSQHKDHLCPAPWRVPTHQDFIDLDKALGGDGGFRTNATIRNRYVTTWGGVYGGVCYTGGSIDLQGVTGFYWSQTARDADSAHNLHFDTPANNCGLSYNIKNRGFMLRCVRN